MFQEVQTTGSKSRQSLTLLLTFLSNLLSLLQVCYYRYIKFYPSGRFLYKVWWSIWLNSSNMRLSYLLLYYLRMIANFTFFLNGQNSSQKLKDVAKFMNFRQSKAECVYRGQYTLSDDKVHIFCSCLCMCVHVYIDTSHAPGKGKYWGGHGNN